MNYYQILEKMENLGITKELFSGDADTIANFYCDDENKNDYKYEEFKEDSVYIEGIGEIQVVNRSGGYSDIPEYGSGVDWEIVRYFSDHKIYIRLSGYYSSYDGLQIDNYDEVKPVSKVIIVYEAI